MALRLIEGGRSDDDDDRDAQAALAEVIAGPEGELDPEVMEAAEWHAEQLFRSQK